MGCPAMNVSSPGQLDQALENVSGRPVEERDLREPAPLVVIAQRHRRTGTRLMTERYIERSVAAMVAASDREPRCHAASWFEVDFHVADDGPRRTLPQSLDQPFEVRATTLGDDVDRAVGSVRDPAIDVEATRRPA